jgi:hypothetical protein
MWVLTYCRRNHNNGLTYGKQHANIQPTTVQKSKDKDVELTITNDINDILMHQEALYNITNISVEPLIIKPWMSSTTTDFDGLRHLIALKISESET